MAKSSQRTFSSPVNAAMANHDGSNSPRWAEPLRTQAGVARLTIVLDLSAAVGAVWLAQWWTPGPVHDRNIALYSWLFVPIVFVLLASRSMYRRKLNHHFLDEFEPVQTSVAVASLGALAAVILLVPPFKAGEIITAYVRPSDLLLRVWVCAAVLIPAVRVFRSALQRYLRRRFRFGVPVLIVGSGRIAHQLITRMRQVPDYGLYPVGVLDDVEPTDAELLGVPYLGTSADFEAAVRSTGAEELVVAPANVPDDKLANTAHLAQRLGIRVRVVPRLMDAVGVGAFVEHLGGVPLLVLGTADPKGWQFTVKHTLDRVIAGVGLLLLSPLFLGLALLVKVSSPGPVMFRQPRVGRDGKVFDCLKFRSMRSPDTADEDFELGEKTAPGGVEGGDRRTRVGRFMRRTSMDELPQLLNVLRGEMSLVGPRPERPEFVDLFGIRVRRYGDRHRVKAGITGWAQVHGLRGQTSIADRAEYDNFYIENWSLLLDFKVLVLTMLAVLKSVED